MSPEYDVIIIGSGPAGIFAAMELAGTSLKVLLMEKGKDLDQRLCPVQDRAKSCIACSPCHLVCGLGGAGAFSDGKLTLSADVGGRLEELIGRSETESLVEYVDGIYLNFGAPRRIYGTGDEVESLRRRATLANLRLVPVRLRHMGTERSRQVLQEMRRFINSRVELHLGEMAKSIVVKDGIIRGVETADGKLLKAKYVIVAPGREGADWLEKEARRLNLTLKSNPVDVGIRVEVPSPVLDEITSVLYESKLEYFSRSFDDRIRTFCMCPGGEVILESTGGTDAVITVNGASYASKKTNNTNFA
ncbi:MAG: NAD(P)/FAD-dependent oxidoreductase, partial [Dehalococcoidia bacterium]|nr:NAD(P)/FAD-dependent oxidoreductase [Dehalococcoidia bacterium]